MKLIDEESMSEWALKQCKEGNDTPEMRNLITDSFYAFIYCRDIKDIEEMWRKVKHYEWSFSYCYTVKDRPEVRKYINRKDYIKYLEEIIKDNKLKRQITNK